MPKTPEDQPIVGQIEFDTMKPKSRALSPEKSLVYALPIKLYGATRVPPSTGRISHDGKSFTQISSEYFFRPGVAMITITDYADDHSVIEQLLFSIQKRLESGQQDTEGIGLPDGVGLKFFIKEERKGKIDAVLRKRFHVVIDLQSIPQEVDPMLILQSINTSALFK